MQRRKFVVGLGSLAAGGAATVGTGAFSKSSSERDATIQVAENDRLGAIKLAPGNTQVAYYDSNGLLTIDLSKGLRGGATGMNPQSTYFFGADIPNSNLPRLEDIDKDDFDEGPLDRPLFTIKNNSVEVRKIELTVTVNNLPQGAEVAMVALSSGGNTAGVLGPLTSANSSGSAGRFNIDPGQVLTVGMIIKSGNGSGDVDLTLEVESNALRN
jgi:hypothetical protein